VAPAAARTALSRAEGPLPLVTLAGLKDFQNIADGLVTEAGLVDLTDSAAKKRFHKAVMRIYFRLIKTGFQFRRDDTGKQMKKCLRQVRASARVIGMQQSNAQFAVHGDSTFGRELRSTVTILPDTALGENFEFGSEPEPEWFLGTAKTMWEALKRRRYVDKSGALQNKNHYVLAHLLNHNVGGSGRDAKNLVPFWAAANTEMERTSENTLKDVVNSQGFRASWIVTCGPDMGMTDPRKALLQAILSRNSAASETQIIGDERVRYDIVLYEQYLPQYLSIALKYWDFENQEHTVGVSPVSNFVPMTIPELV
jgi:hypothetical protein